MVTTRKDLKLIQRGLRVAPTACSVVAVGSILPGSAACRAVATSRPTSGTTTLASALPSPSNTRSLVNEDEVSLMQSFAAKYEAGEYDKNNTTIIIVSPDPISSLPLSLLKYIIVLEILPPTTEEIKDYVLSASRTEIKDNRTKNDVDNMVRTLQGLQMYEVRQTLKTVNTTNLKILCSL